MQDVVEICSTKQHILFFLEKLESAVLKIESWVNTDRRLASSPLSYSGLEPGTSCSDVYVTGCIALDAVCDQNEGSRKCGK